MQHVCVHGVQPWISERKALRWRPGVRARCEPSEQRRCWSEASSDFMLFISFCETPCLAMRWRRARWSFLAFIHGMAPWTTTCTRGVMTCSTGSGDRRHEKRTLQSVGVPRMVVTG
jgi:hypothetical protein